MYNIWCEGGLIDQMFDLASHLLLAKVLNWNFKNAISKDIKPL